MAFWLYIDSKDRKAVWYLLRGVELASQGKASTEGRQVRNKQRSLPPLPPAPKLRNKTKQNKKNDLIPKGTPKENKRKKRKTRNRVHFAIVGSTAPPLDFMHSFHSVDFFFNCVGFCFFCLRRTAELGM